MRNDRAVCGRSETFAGMISRPRPIKRENIHACAPANSPKACTFPAVLQGGPRPHEMHNALRAGTCPALTQIRNIAMNVKQPFAISRGDWPPSFACIPCPLGEGGARNAGPQPARGPVHDATLVHEIAVTTDTAENLGVPRAVFEACSATTPEDRHPGAGDQRGILRW
jgi:hypothetical protein